MGEKGSHRRILAFPPSFCLCLSLALDGKVENEAVPEPHQYLNPTYTLLSIVFVELESTLF